MKKVTLVQRNGRNKNYIYIEYHNSELDRTCWMDYTIGSRKSEDKLYGPKAKLYQQALDFAGVEDFSNIPYGESYTEPQGSVEAEGSVEEEPNETTSKVIYISGIDFAPEGGTVAYPAEFIPREDFNALYQAGAMYKDPELDGWVIDPEKARAAGYTCKEKDTGAPAGAGFRK